jgi:hypothetical protein
MQGQLFTSDYLLRGIMKSAAWEATKTPEYAAFRVSLVSALGKRSADDSLVEAQTESEIVAPILNALGFTDAWLPQINLSKKGREDVPDYLLFADAPRKAEALKLPDDKRPKLGIALVEAKRWQRELDRRDDSGGDTTKKLDFGAPSSQMLRYLSRADVASDRAIKWGMLTNGGTWRLYYQDARSRSEEFLELNIAAALGVAGVERDLLAPPDEDVLKLFYLLFSRAAFLPQAWDTGLRTLHQIALNEARLYEEQVSESLGKRVFAEVFPQLANALVDSDLQKVKDRNGQLSREYLEEVREAALVLLYRLLFVLYAEDRRLLPVADVRYKPYSLSKLREEIADAIDKRVVHSSRAKNYWNTLNDLFEIIAQGDDKVGMPAYNGGLFERARAPLLARVGVPDDAMAKVIDALSRRVEDISKPRINYRDLSVSHLGGIYERLLEYALVQEASAIAARPASFARKVSGSYYTHDDLVRLILDEAVGRLADEKLAAFHAQMEAFRTRKSLRPNEWEALEAVDPAAQLLELKICDPAMGSGHFLVALVDWLAGRVLEAIETVEESVNAMPWASHLVDQGKPYSSPLIARLAHIRVSIKKAGDEHGWALDDRQLDDRHIVRRMILKKVIFGVDKNPMAVELAKVALWLHTFTVGAPLSFLDHHLKCGDSLHGEKLGPIQAEIRERGAMFDEGNLASLAAAAKSLEEVADLTDTSIAEAHESKRLADEAEANMAHVHALLSFWRALRWLVPGWPEKFRKTKVKAGQEPTQTQLAIAEIFNPSRNIVLVADAGRIEGSGPSVDAANALLAQARALATRERFFHWWTAFPNVWKDGGGGFDAVIGNPPWDMLQMQEVEWFSERLPAVAMQVRAADRKAAILREEKRKSPVWNDFVAASGRSDAEQRVVRECGEYPMLSEGRSNLFKLFVERAQFLVQPQGIVGLLTPSGIAADKGASAFFRSITSPPEQDLFGDKGTRLAAFFDFENRSNPSGSYFPDVDSRFKFCAFIFGGMSRRFDSAKCGFFLHSLDDIASGDRVLHLGAEDFARVNPNTGAAPIFRTKRDAEITSRIYAENPVLVRHGFDDKDRVISEEKAWPVRYFQGTFNMTSDSEHFKTRTELQSLGFVPAAQNRWKNGKIEALPLYEGKMVQMFDHRAADIVLNNENLHRAAQQEAIQESAKQQPDRFPSPQFYTLAVHVEKSVRDTVIAFKDVTAPTNMRTMIAAFVPYTGFGNTLPYLKSDEPLSKQCLLLANLCSSTFDFVARQKVQGQHLNWYIVEQLPVIAPDRFEHPLDSLAISIPAAQKAPKTREISPETVADFIRAEVLALTYTAHDMAAFATDMGYVGADGKVKPPFVWNTHDRSHRMARLDAIFMKLYGMSEDDAAYILSTFPIVREKDEKAHGRFRAQDLILTYMRALDAGALTHADVVE